MRHIKYIPFALFLLFCAGAVALSQTDDPLGWVANLFGESDSGKFEADDWQPKGPVPLPVLGRVEMQTGQDTAVIHPTADPSVFDSASALERDTWKLIIVNQFKGRTGDTYRLDSNLLNYMKGVKATLADSGLPTEIWFLRLNRPYRNNGWTLPDMYRKCGSDGRQCFDHYLVFAQSSIDYSLERDYLSALDEECSVSERSDAMAVVVVDPQGQLRHTYSSCYLPVSAAHLLKNFDHHTSADITQSFATGKEFGQLPSYSLETTAKDQLRLEGQRFIQQVSDSAKELSESARQSFDEAVEKWK